MLLEQDPNSVTCTYLCFFSEEDFKKVITAINSILGTRKPANDGYLGKTGCFPGTFEIVLVLHRSLASTREGGFSRTSVGPHTRPTTCLLWASFPRAIQG